jgi:hypothetical protein
LDSRTAGFREAWPFIWPALPPLIMMAVGTRVFSFFTQSPAGIAPPAWPHAPPGSDGLASIVGALALAKASAYATSLVFLCVGVVCLVLCHLVIARQLPKRRFRAEAAVWALVVVAAWVVFSTSQTRPLDFFGKDLFERTVVPSAGWLTTGPLGRWSAFYLMFQGVTIVAVVAGCYVVGAICVTLGATTHSSPDGFAAKVRSDLKYLLFAASSVFVLGVVCAHAFSGWLGSFYVATESSEHKQFSLALQAYIGLQATVYFLILGAMFAPVTYVALRRRSPLWTAGRSGPAVWSDIVQHLVALAAPLITAPLLALIGAPPA